MRLPLIALATLIAAPAFAADEPIPRIIVSGTGQVSTPPDRVAIQFSVHGEGATSDEAVSAMVAKRKAIDGGIATFGKADAKASNISIAEVRGRDCNRGNYQSKLSTGECAIIGYTADIQMELRTDAVKDSGTIIGLIGRLGGTNPHIERFYLSNDGPAQSRALAQALAEARTQAEAIAAGAHVPLGRILSISNGSYQVQPFADIVVSGSRIEAPAPPPPPPPVVVSLTPKAIETQERVQVVFAIGG